MICSSSIVDKCWKFAFFFPSNLVSIALLPLSWLRELRATLSYGMLMLIFRLMLMFILEMKMLLPLPIDYESY